MGSLPQVSPRKRTSRKPTNSQEQENQQEGEGTEGEQDTDDGDQGTEESDQDTPEDNSLAGLKRQWVELNKELDTQQIAFDEAEEDTRADEQAKYEEMIGKAHELVEKIKEAAIAELAEASDKQPIFETLLGIMINDATFSKDAEIMRVGKLLIDNGIDKEYFDKASKAERLSLPSRAYFEELTAQLEQKDVVLPQVKIATSKGDIVVELFEIEAPDTVGNFISLVESNFYDGLTFHRVLDGFMAQGGCPNGDGSGDAGYSIFSEYENEGARNHFAGSISMANSGKDTGEDAVLPVFRTPPHPTSWMASTRCLVASLREWTCSTNFSASTPMIPTNPIQTRLSVRK